METKTLYTLKRNSIWLPRRSHGGCACSNIEASEYYAPYWKRDPRKSEKAALHTKASNSWYACLAMLDKIDECL